MRFLGLAEAVSRGCLCFAPEKTIRQVNREGNCKNTNKWQASPGVIPGVTPREPQKALLRLPNPDAVQQQDQREAPDCRDRPVRESGSTPASSQKTGLAKTPPPEPQRNQQRHPVGGNQKLVKKKGKTLRKSKEGGLWRRIASTAIGILPQVGRGGRNR